MYARAGSSRRANEGSFDATLREEGSSGEYGDRSSGQVWRGNADLTLRGLRRDKARAPIAGRALYCTAAKRKKITWRTLAAGRIWRFSGSQACAGYSVPGAPLRGLRIAADHQPAQRGAGQTLHLHLA